jgi:thiol-disulfide isomerase/thioredoxin
MRIMQWALVAAFAVAGLIVPAMLPQADLVRAEGEDDATKDPVLAAWEAYKTARADANQQRTAALAEYRKVNSKEGATDEEKQAAMAKYREASEAAAKALEGPESAFYDQLSKVKIEQYAEHTDMLETGLMGLANKKREEAPAEAAALYEELLKYCGSSRTATAVRTHYLPAALAGTGDLDKAIKRCNELIADVDDQNKPNLLIRIGDYSAASGDLKAAVKAYEKGLSMCEGELERGDPRINAKRYLELRAKLTGKDAPNVDSKTWLGGEARSLADLKGNVVIIDFWATWCGPCRVAMPGIDKIYKENKDKGVIAIGLTRFYANGFLPDDSSNLSKGESVRGITEETYVDHLQEFKKRSGLSYPFVVGQKEDFDAYGVTGIPTMAIVNKEGKIAMIVVGSGNDALIEACVNNLSR